MRDPWERLKAIDQVLSEGPITDEMLNAQSDRDTRSLNKPPKVSPPTTVGDYRKMYVPSKEDQARIQAGAERSRMRLANLRPGDPGYNSQAAKNARYRENMRAGGDVAGLVGDLAGIAVGVAGMIAPEPSSSIAGTGLAINRGVSLGRRATRIYNAIKRMGAPLTQSSAVRRQTLAATTRSQADDAVKAAVSSGLNNPVTNIAAGTLRGSRGEGAFTTLFNLAAARNKIDKLNQTPEMSSAQEVQRRRNLLDKETQSTLQDPGKPATPEKSFRERLGIPVGTPISATSTRSKDLVASSARR